MRTPTSIFSVINSHANFIAVRQNFPIQNNANVASNAFTGTVDVVCIDPRANA